MSLLIRHGTVVTPRKTFNTDVYVEQDTISAIGPSLSYHADQILDASGKLVIPGGVDVHTHFDAPVGGTTSSDDFETGTRAAAFGGTTCVIDFATQSKGKSLIDAYTLWRDKGKKAVIDFGLHMIVVDIEGRLGELDEIIKEGITSFKLFTAYPGVLMINDGTLLQVLRHVGSLGALVAVHAENGSAIDVLVRAALAEGRRAPIEHARTRPAVTEAEAVHRVIALARIAEVPVYIVHVTCAEALAEIEHARGRGLPVFGETCPHYLLLTSKELARPGFEGAKFVLTPPLREDSDREALWNGLRNNSLQVVSTDHCPFFYETQKKAGLEDFTRIPNGGPGVEHRLELLYHFGVNAGRFTVNRWVDLVAEQPARLFGLFPRKGVLEVGSDADIVVWNPHTEHTISAASHHMRVDYSMFEGMRVKGAAETVISRGEVIIDHGAWRGTPGRGQFLKRSCFAGAWPAGRGSAKML
jgi:dihydropyrimidinase